MHKLPETSVERSVMRVAQAFLPFLKTQSRKLKATKGFTVLFAMLIAALLLGVGLAIFDIIFKEVSFATVVRDSNYASYAADTGSECALYWDIKYTGSGNFGSGGIAHSAFATSSNSTAPTTGLICNGTDVLSDPTSVSIVIANGYPGVFQTGATGATTTFAFYMNTDGTGNHMPPYCSIVEVVKNTTASGILNTYIISRGYNTCDTNNPNRIERAYFISY